MTPTGGVAGGPIPGATPAAHTNVLERLLPTVGSIGGGILGGIAGIPGDLFSGGAASAAGGIAGASGGGALGRALENLLSGQNVKNDLGSSAVEGGLGQATGLGAAKLLGGAGSVLGNLGDQFAGKEAAANSEEALSNAFPDAALNAPTRKALNFGQTLDLADQTGVDKTPEAFLQASNAATGANGVLNGTLDSAVTGSGPVDLSGFGDIVDNALNDNVGTLGSTEATTAGRGGLPKIAANPATNTKQMFTNMLQQTGYGGEGSLDNETDPDAALTLLRNIGEQRNKFAGASDVSPGTPAAAMEDVYNKVYGGLKNALYNRPEVNEAVSNLQLTPEDVQAISKTTGGNATQTQHLVDTINNATRANDITKVESQYVNMGKAGQKTLDYVNNVLGTGASANAARQAATIPIPGSIPSVSGGILKTGANLAGQGLQVAGPTTLKVGGSVLNGLAAVAPATAITAANLPNDVATGTNSLPSQPITSDNATGASAMTPTQPTNIFQSLVPNSGASQNYAPIALQALLGMFDPNLLNSTVEGNAATAQQGIQKATQASALLPNLEQEFSQSGGGQGLAGGLLSRIGGLIPGTPASNYNAQAASEARALSNATGSTITPAELPQLTQSSQTANDTLQRLQSLLSALGAPAQ